MIYEIVCNETGERYIGSTFEPTLARRIAAHRRCQDCMSKQIIGRGNYSYGLLEKVNIETRDELRMYERKWYDKLPNINIRTPYRSKKEQQEYNIQYNKSNRDKINVTRKETYNANKDEINAKRRELYAKKRYKMV